MFRVIATLLACLLFFPVDASAADRQFGLCMDRADGITSEMLDCIGEAQHRADARLVTTLSTAVSSISPARRFSLHKAQEAWLAYRQAHCNFLADLEGGTSASLISADCWLSLAEERVAFLDTLVDHSTVLLR
jgi:uncharacterized protein YecT (DUF1311 family)